MKITSVLRIVAIVIPSASFAQTPINKTIPLQSGQSIVMHFDYPELVQVSTWDKNEISIQGTVDINGGENDDAFVMENSTAGGTVNIRSEIRNLKSLPQRITVCGQGKKIMFKD